MNRLKPEEIRARASHIVHMVNCDKQEAKILELIEDVTGEKLPEPFDESQIRHLSVWETLYGGKSHIVILSPTPPRDSGSNDFYCIHDGHFGDTLSKTTKTTKAIAAHLQSWQFRYIGQYNFFAGLPKP